MSPSLQPECYPHIFAAICAESTLDTLLALRRVSHASCERADAVLFRHARLVIDWEGRVVLHAERGPRLAGDLRGYESQLPLHHRPALPANHAHLQRILPHIRTLAVCGAFEFGCVPSLSTLAATVRRMYGLQRIMLVPDPYGRRWRGRGGLVLDLDPSVAFCSVCSVQTISRPPSPPLSSPYEARKRDDPEEDTTIVLRHHRGAAFDPAVLSLLGDAAEVTFVLSLWSPSWTSSRADRLASVSTTNSASGGHAAFVSWRYVAAAEYVARTVALGKRVAVVGLEQVHPAYLDHEWKPDYETLSCFRERVGGALARLRCLDPEWDDDQAEEPEPVPPARGRNPYRGYLPTPEATPSPLSEVYELEEEPSLDPSTSGLVDPGYFAHAVNRLRDYESSSRSSSPSVSCVSHASPSRSPSAGAYPLSPPRSGSSSRSRSRVVSPGPSSSSARRPARSPSATRSACSATHSLYSCMSFMTHVQYAASQVDEIGGELRDWWSHTGARVLDVL